MTANTYVVVPCNQYLEERLPVDHLGWLLWGVVAVGFAVGGSAFLLTEVMLLQLGCCSVVVADNCDARVSVTFGCSMCWCCVPSLAGCCAG
jgi:hypothetical protein